jgi:hypothetical protein
MNAARLHTAPNDRIAGPLRVIRNGKVRGDELFAAVSFLADALQLPALRDGSRANAGAARQGKVIALAPPR